VKVEAARKNSRSQFEGGKKIASLFLFPALGRTFVRCGAGP